MIYVAEFEGTSKGTFQRVFTSVADMFSDWQQFMNSTDRREHEWVLINHGVFRVATVGNDHKICNSKWATFNEDGDVIEVARHYLHNSDPEFSQEIEDTYYGYFKQYIGIPKKVLFEKNM